MQEISDRPVGVMDDEAHAARVRKFASIALAVLVLAVVSSILVGGSEYFHVTGWMLIPGVLGSVTAIRVLRHPELVGRLDRGPALDEIIAQGGLRIPAAQGHPTSLEMRVAVQEALDSVRTQLGPPSRRVLVRGIWVVGGVGWLAGAVASIVIGRDVAAAGLCVAAAAGCGALAWWATRVFDRLGTAERTLEAQFLALEAGVGPVEELAAPAGEGG